MDPREPGIKKRSFIGRLKIKVCRWLLASFPMNKVRIQALRWCGFKVGKQVYLAHGIMLIMMDSEHSCYLEIGDRASIASGVIFILSSHPNNSVLNKVFPGVRGSIIVKEDAWLGAGVIVQPNIEIGEASVVAAGSVVTKNVAPRTLVGGIPATKIKDIVIPE